MAKIERRSAAALLYPHSLLAAIYPDVDRRSRILPEDLIVAEILPRLHVTALFTFRCVSKRYKVIISCPEFGRNYMQRAYNSSPELSGLLASKTTMVFPFMDLSPYRDIFSMEVKELTETIKSSWSGSGSGGEEDKEFGGLSVNSVTWLPYCNAQRMLASSNGLILSNFEGSSRPRFGLCVWNPLTRHCVRIPNPKPLLHPSFVYTLAPRREAAAFLTYKVVALRTHCLRPATAIFSSDTGRWVTWNPSRPGNGSLPLLHKRGGFAYKGVLHWLIAEQGTVLTYDPYNSPDRFDRFPLPKVKHEKSSLVYSGEEEAPMYCEVESSCSSRPGFDRVSLWRLGDDSAEEERWCFEGEFWVPSLDSRGREPLLVAPNPWNRDVICHPYLMRDRFRAMNPRSGTSKVVHLFTKNAVPKHFGCFRTTYPLLPVELCPWSSPFYARGLRHCNNFAAAAASLNNE